MDESKRKKPIVTAEEEIEAVIQRESEEALRRFRSGDFAARLKSRLEGPLPPRPLFLFRRPVLVPALGLLVLTAAALLVFYHPGGRNGRLETGFRFMTETLAQTEFFRNAEHRFFPGVTGDSTSGGTASFFSEALIRVAAEPQAGFAEGGDPLRPLFSPKERFKILYGDQAILRVLTMISTQKEG